MTTRRVRVLRALKLHPAGLKLAALGDVLQETKVQTNGPVWYQLKQLIEQGYAMAEGLRRSRVYRITPAGVAYLEDLEAGRAHVIQRRPRRPHNEKFDRVVIHSTARLGQAPLGAISSVFQLGRAR